MELDSYRQLQKLYGQNANFYSRIVDFITKSHDDEAGAYILEKLKSGNSHLDRQLIADLSQFSKEPDTEVAPNIQHARNVIREVFTDNSWGYFRGMGLEVVLYGSLQYGDPRHMDADVLVVSRKQESLEFSKGMIGKIREDLITRWKKEKIGTDPHIATFALEDLFTIPTNNNLSPELKFYSVCNTAEALTGIPLFKEESLLLGNFKHDLDLVVDHNPLYAAMTNASLQECLNNRLQRRKQP